MAWLNEKRRLNKATGKNATYWALAWREAGKVRTRGLGFCSRDEAKAALKIAEGKMAVGEQVAPTPTGAGSSPAAATPTLREYLEQVYLPVVARDKAPKTHEMARTSARNLNAILGHLPLDRVDYAAADAYLSERRKLGRRSRTLQIELWVLGNALKHAENCGVMERVPKLPRVRLSDRRPHRYLTVEESERLLDALRPLTEQPHAVARGRPSTRRDRLTYLVVLVALNTGMRKGEIVSRGWEDVRWGMGPHGAIVVSAKPEIGFRVKTGHDRAVPMTPELHAALEGEHVSRGRPTTGWIFTSPTDPTKPRADFKKALERACERAGLPAIHPHGLRHTWASRLAAAGVDRRTLMELGGWRVGQMLDGIYSHVTDGHKAEVMARMGVGTVR